MWARLGLRVTRVQAQRGLQVLKVIRVWLAQPARSDRPEPREISAAQVLSEPRVQLELSDLRVRKATLEWGLREM